MNAEQVEIYLGDTVDNDAEQRVLSRLRRDLSARGIPARIFANFYTKRRRQQRQIDLFVITPCRAALVELKNYSTSLPLTGGVNGRWRQTLLDGTQRELDGNPISQVKGCAFSLSDDMRDLAAAGEVPEEKPFFKGIDTLVCLYPVIPPGSAIERADHVTVLGYDELLDRLATPGRSPRWAADDWNRLALHLNLYPLDYRPPERVEPALVELQDYCRRFIRGRTLSLHDLVELTARLEDGSPTRLDLLPHTRHGQTITVIGPPGAGKTHVATHAAIQLARSGSLAIWARCDDFQRKPQLSLLLARAVAPYTTADPRSLIDAASVAGRDAVLILDGLNDCDDTRRTLLLEQLASLRLRHPISVVITSTEPVATLDETVLTEMRTVPPTPEQRKALLESHGADPDLGHTQAFETPFELSLAATCAQDLGPAPSRADLYDAYVQRRCGSLTTRVVLRQVARQLGEQLTSSLPISDVMVALERNAAHGFASIAIDEALENPLLVVGQGRVRFRHDLFARFLAADDLVHRADDGTALAELLDDPRHRDLTDFVIELEKRPGHRHDLLRSLADDGCFQAALLGRYGDGVRARLESDVRAVFSAALELTASAWLEVPLDRENVHSEPWRLTGSLNPLSRSLLAATARCLDYGLFIEEMAGLLEATDDRVEAAVAALREAGFQAPISAAVASTYGIPRRGEEMLPASIVIETMEHHSRWPGRERGNVPVAAELLRTSHRRGWGLLYLAFHMCDGERPADCAVFPGLLEAAWSVRGYHLQLQALDTARYMRRHLEDTPEYGRVKDFLLVCETSGLGLNTMLGEALAAYDAIEPTTTLTDIRSRISEVLAAPVSAEVDAAAYGIFSWQFEPQDIVGPYFEAIEGLAPDDRRRLLIKAARGRPSYGSASDTIIDELVKMATPGDTDIREVLGLEAGRLDTESISPQEAVAVHVLAVQGMGIFGAHLPAQDTSLPAAWRRVDELVLALARGREPEIHEAGARNWPVLLNEEAGSAIDVLLRMSRAYGTLDGDSTSYLRLTDAFPDEVRRLLEWGINHLDLITRTTPLSSYTVHAPFIIRELGRLGIRETAHLLEPWLADPQFGDEAASAIRRLRQHGG